VGRIGVAMRLSTRDYTKLMLACEIYLEKEAMNMFLIIIRYKN
jgi:hypothetical protein